MLSTHRVWSVAPAPAPGPGSGPRSPEPESAALCACAAAAARTLLPAECEVLLPHVGGQSVTRVTFRDTSAV